MSGGKIITAYFTNSKLKLKVVVYFPFISFPHIHTNVNFTETYFHLIFDISGSDGSEYEDG
jgi:hypothetical protein